MFIGVFPSFTLSGRSRSGVFCKVCFTYSMLIRGFSQFRFQRSRPFLGSFARHVDKHISDYLVSIYLVYYLVSSVDKGFFLVSFSMVESQVFCKIRLYTNV